MNLLEIALTLTPTFLKQELLIARNERRDPNFAAVAEDSFNMANMLIAEFKNYNSFGALAILNSDMAGTTCIPGYKRHLSKGDGTCIRCNKQFRTNFYKKKTA